MCEYLWGIYVSQFAYVHYLKKKCLENPFPDILYVWIVGDRKIGAGGVINDTKFQKFRFIKRDVGSIEFHSDAGCKSFYQHVREFFSFWFCFRSACVCIQCVLCMLLFPSFVYGPPYEIMTGDITPPR